MTNYNYESFGGNFVSKFIKLKKLKYFYDIYGKNILDKEKAYVICRNACRYRKYNVLKFIGTIWGFDATICTLLMSILSGSINCVKYCVSNFYYDGIDNPKNNNIMCHHAHIGNKINILRYLYNEGFCCKQYIIDKYQLVR